VAEVQILSRIAHSEPGPEEQLNAAARGQTKFTSVAASNAKVAAAAKATTAADARKTIGAWMSDPKSALMDRSNPGHKAAVAEYLKLVDLL